MDLVACTALCLPWTFRGLRSWATGCPALRMLLGHSLRFSIQNPSFPSVQGRKLWSIKKIGLRYLLFTKESVGMLQKVSFKAGVWTVADPSPASSCLVPGNWVRRGQFCPWAKDKPLCAPGGVLWERSVAFLRESAIFASMR